MKNVYSSVPIKSIHHVQTSDKTLSGKTQNKLANKKTRDNISPHMDKTNR